MFRRLATIAAALTLAACSDAFDAPTGVSRQQVIDENPTTLPPEACLDYIVEEFSIPQCVDPLYWPGAFSRVRHSYETMNVAGGGRRGRMF